MKRSLPAGLPRAVLLLAALAPTALAGQTARVAVEQENFRAEPQGSILAELVEGATLQVGQRQGRWRQATLQAWIWAPSVQEQRAGELDLVVNAGGENLRAEPNGPVVAFARGGMRLDRLESRDRWVRVQRTAWIWEPSIRVLDAPTPTAETPTAEPAPARRTGGRASDTGAAPERATTAGPVVLLDTPAGDTLARLGPQSTVEVLAREGDWARVRVEGWTFTGSLTAPDSAAAQVLTGIGRDSIEADPERFRGRLVQWSLQFIALQEAERFRTDFLEGEPFILARGPGEDPGFVYVAVPADMMEAVGALDPLERIVVLGRIRTPRSSLTGAPVLELVDIRSR